MRRLLAPLPLLLVALGAGCSRRAKSSLTSADAGPPASGAASAPADAGARFARSEPVFSAPIAATRVAHLSVVAGLVGAQGVVRLSSWRDDAPEWTADVFPGAVWSPDAELKLQPAGNGVALVWRGNLGGKVGRELLQIGPHGEPRGEPISIGAGFCTTADGLAWLDPRTHGPFHVRARRWTEVEVRDVVAVSADRDVTLLCGDRDVFVLGSGDDDLTSTRFVPGDATGQPPTVAIRDADFGADDEREHDVYAVGDDMGVVRVASSGAVALREVRTGDGATPWRKLRHALPADDDVVAVDGDAKGTIIVFTHDAGNACPPGGSSAESVRALRVDRKTSEESLLDLAPANCDVAPGPFWIGSSGGAPVVAWVERKTRVAQSAAPIEGLAFRVVRADGVRAGRSAVEADAVVDAGCDESGCLAVALVRAPDSDGMRPASVVPLRYP